MVTRDYDIFQNKLNDLETSLSLIDLALKEVDAKSYSYSLKEINLARSILIRSMHISIYELFIQYTNTQIRRFVNSVFLTGDIQTISKFLKSNKNTISKITIGFDDLELLMNTPNSKIETKIISCFQNRKKDKTYINSIESLMNLKFENDLKENVTLFIAMRHIFVHNNGKINNDWRKEFSKALHQNQFKLKIRRKEFFLPTDYIHLRIVIENYSKFCKVIEEHITKTPTEAGV